MTISAFFCLLLLVFFSTVGPFLSAISPNISCSFNSTSSSEPCKAYISYRAKKTQFLDVGKISDLFGVSRLAIAEASNLVSEDATLKPEQLLLIPLPCACMGGRYLANVTYDIQKGDSFYFLSSIVFQNLTNWHDVEEMNPLLNPNLLSIGINVTIPLFCKCPSADTTDSDEGIEYFITYVWQPNDQVSAVADKFSAMESDIYRENNDLRSFDEAAVGMPLLIPVSELPTLWQPNSLNAAKRSSTSITKRVIIIIVGSVAGVAIFVLVLVAIALRVGFSRKRGNLRAMAPKHSNTYNLSYAKILRCKGLPMETVDSIQQQQKDSTIKEDKLLHGVSDCLSKPIIVYECGAIMEATLNLSEKLKIKGSVFKAMIEGKLLAVKRMKEEDQELLVSEELEILQRVNHANLVKLMGVASYGAFFVYEYAENGSLDKWLFSSSVGLMLTWRQRVQIAVDVANGLQYLHEHTQPSILHGNIRSSNILLDVRFKAKLSNFSRARSAASTDHLGRATSLKTDVYGFGVVLLELLSGKKGGGNKERVLELSEEEKQEEQRKERRVRDWMDPNLRGFYNMEGALTLVNLARLCTLQDWSVRPSMGEIVFNLCLLAAEDTTPQGQLAHHLCHPTHQSCPVLPR